MKKLIYGTLFLAVVGIGIVGCKKEGVVKDENANILKYASVKTFKPLSYSEISNLYGSQHNAVLNYVLIEEPTENQEDLEVKFEKYYQNSILSSYFDKDISSKILPDLNSYIFDKINFMKKLNEIRDSFFTILDFDRIKQ